MEFLRPFLRRNFAGKPLVSSRNVGCFLRLQLRQDKMFLCRFSIISVFILPIYFLINLNISAWITSLNKITRSWCRSLVCLGVGTWGERARAFRFQNSMYLCHKGGFDSPVIPDDFRIFGPHLYAKLIKFGWERENDGVCCTQGKSTKSLTNHFG